MVNTVKIQGEGYLVDGFISVPNATGNRHWQAVQEWIAEGNTPEPEFTQAELDAQAAQAAAEADTKVKEDSVRADTLLQNFIALGPDGIETYIDNNSTNIANANEILKKLAKIVWLSSNRQF